jgi:hypothetical protein
MKQYVFDELVNAIALLLADSDFSIVFDGSKANILIEATLIRFVNKKTGAITQLCIAATAVPRSLDGVQLKGLLMAQLQRLTASMS